MPALQIPTRWLVGEYFVIRHKPSGRFIPAVPRGTGASFLEPMSTAYRPPRMFMSVASAKGFLGQWLRGQHVNIGDAEEPFVKVTPVSSRVKEDMEIIPLALVFKELP